VSSFQDLGHEFFDSRIDKNDLAKDKIQVPKMTPNESPERTTHTSGGF